MTDEYAPLPLVDDLAEALAEAENQWGHDYLWEKWDLSAPMREYRKLHPDHWSAKKEQA